MKYSPFITSALAVSLLLAGSAPALAEDTAQVTVQGSTTVTVGDDHRDGDSREGRDGTFLQGLKNRLYKDKENRDGDSEYASSTREDKKQEHMQDRIEKQQERAGNEIDKRIESLTKLKERLAEMKLLSADVLASISASLDAEIAKLQTLKTQIGNDTSTTTLKADASIIKKGLRVFLVVEPKARIAASASRINAVVTQMNLLATKLQTRIATAKAAGVNTTAAEAALVDLRAKIADAKVQADAAVAMTVNLQPDNGNATVQASNLQALKDARAKLVLAQKDLADARHDAGVIRGDVNGKEGEGHASTTPSH